MRIKEIQVKGLFGMFDHTIPLNLDEHLTIIYGINGIGKTMLFKILDSFFNYKFHILFGYPFDSLTFKFEDDSFIELTNSPTHFIINHQFKNIDDKNKEIEFDKEFFFDLIKNESFQKIQSYEFRIGSRNLGYNQINKNNNFIENIDLGKIILYLYEKKSIDNNILKTDIYFIETQRLLQFDEKNEKIETIKKYSNDLAQLIQDKHRDYAKKSEEFEISLSKRLVNQEIEVFSNINELKTENNLLEEERERLKSVGLFENIKYEKVTLPNDINEVSKAVLSVNIQDMKKKLEIFKDLYIKLELFIRILNEKRFSFKKISIDPQRGFIFKNDNGKELNLTDLSSGEQHEVVLLYELLFKVSEKSLVLIDEPEISLHIVWQKEFLKDLQEIIKIRNFDVLIATHSPSIIDENWDLTVELEKPTLKAIRKTNNSKG